MIVMMMISNKFLSIFKLLPNLKKELRKLFLLSTRQDKGRHFGSEMVIKRFTSVLVENFLIVAFLGLIVIVFFFFKIKETKDG